MWVALVVVQFEIASAFAQNATGVLGITGRERSTCPRCKGSGLYEGRSVWKWGQPSPSNTSCWFCDGYASTHIFPQRDMNFYGLLSSICKTSINPCSEV